jgi:peptide/nickel transport system permease protein
MLSTTDVDVPPRHGSRLVPPPGARTATRGRRLWTVARRHPAAAVAGGFLLVLVIASLCAPILPLPDPVRVDSASATLGFGTAGHLLGADRLGRDILSRLIWGARPSLIMGLAPVLIGGAIGTTLGVTAGMSGPRVRGVIMRTLDVFYAFPAVLLAIAIAAALGAGMTTAIIAITVIVVPPVARLAESEVLGIMRKDFMLSARASGAGQLSIALRQVMPNVAGPLLVYCTALVGLSIVYAAGLGFLGLGLNPPTPEWGAMVNELRTLVFSQPWVSLTPAVMLLLVSISFNVLGDGLRDVLAVGRGTQL